MKEHLALLGMHARDLVTGYTGVVSSICFDLYGCVQAAVTPPINKDGKLPDSLWFDVKRLHISGNAPVMCVPDFNIPAGKEKGGAPPPAFHALPGLRLRP